MMQTLRAEHRHMGSVLSLFAQHIDAIEAGDAFDAHVLYEIMDYITAWPDRFHHPREDLIYARVAELNADAADEVDTLQRDHDYTAKSGKKLLKDIARWQQGKMKDQFVVKNSRAYVDHVYEHMRVEEELVFPHIEASLSAQDWRELADVDAIVAVSKPVFGPVVQREYRALSRKLRRGLRRGVERSTMVEWVTLDALMDSLDALSIGYESARDTTKTNFRDTAQQAQEYFRESPLSAPLLCVANNTRVTFKWVGELAEISSDTVNDISRVNAERKDRLELLKRLRD